MDMQVFTLFADNILAGIAAFIAIIVWVKTRDSSWVFIVLAVLGYYTSVIYNTFIFFGIILQGNYVLYGIDLIYAAFRYIPVLFLIIALVIKAVKNMKR
ncbi:MAG: hypothetical protein H7A26_04370 [Spirochaetales bacterium]|nr:hypothetical protein [Spirochaetales bacterium]